MSCPVIELTMQLIRCPSVSPNDAGCQDLIIKRLLASGFNVERIDFGNTRNLWAWRGQGETLAFVGHTDVVSTGNIKYWINNPFKPIIQNGILYGRGAADMKGALAAIIVAVERFVALYPNHKIRLAFLITSDEESNTKNGTVKVVEILMKRNEHLEYCIIGEPSSEKIVGDVIKNGRRGSLTCSLIIHGIQGHVAYPHLANNPIHRSIPMLKELITTKWDHGNKFFQPTNMQIVNVQVMNDNDNVIPSDMFIKFNFRFSNELTDIKIKNRVIKLLKKYQLHYTIKWQLSGHPFLTQHGKLLNTVIKTITHFNKIKPQLLTNGGTSDGRFIANMGAQIVELGLINTTIHKINECVNTSDLQLLSHMYQHIIEQLAI